MPLIVSLAATIAADDVVTVVPPAPAAVTSRTRLPVVTGITVEPVAIAVPFINQRRVMIVVLFEVPSFALKVAPIWATFGEIDGRTLNTGGGGASV